MIKIFKGDKSCSRLYFIKTIQVKIAMWYHYKPIGMAKIENTDNAMCWWRCGTTETYSLLLGGKSVQQLENYLAVFCKNKYIFNIWSSTHVSLYLYIGVKHTAQKLAHKCL